MKNILYNRQFYQIIYLQRVKTLYQVTLQLKRIYNARFTTLPFKPFSNDAWWMRMRMNEVSNFLAKISPLLLFRERFEGYCCELYMLLDRERQTFIRYYWDKFKTSLNSFCFCIFRTRRKKKFYPVTFNDGRQL